MGRRAAPSAVSVRRRFFGAANVAPDGSVRPDRLVASWFGVAGFALAVGGHVVLLDAWVPRGLVRGYVPTSPDELAHLRPAAVFIGHGHFDHAADAAAVVAASGAILVGTPAHRDAVERRVGRSVDFLAAAAGPRPGERREIDLLGGVGVTALTHVHAAATLPDPGDTGGLHRPAVVPPDPRPLLRHRGTKKTLRHLLRHLLDREGGCVLYQFRVGGTALTWHDTSGPLHERAPAAARELGRLPATTVEIGAIMGYNQLFNGLRDPRRYVEALCPEVFVPCHHDNWLPGLTARGRAYEPLLSAELGRLPPGRRPQVRFLADPHDYLRPSALTFAV